MLSKVSCDAIQARAKPDGGPRQPGIWESRKAQPSIVRTRYYRISSTPGSSIELAAFLGGERAFRRFAMILDEARHFYLPHRKLATLAKMLGRGRLFNVARRHCDFYIYGRET